MALLWINIQGKLIFILPFSVWGCYTLFSPVSLKDHRLSANTRCKSLLTTYALWAKRLYLGPWRSVLVGKVRQIPQGVVERSLLWTVPDAPALPGSNWSQLSKTSQVSKVEKIVTFPNTNVYIAHKLDARPAEWPILVIFYGKYDLLRLNWPES